MKKGGFAFEYLLGFLISLIVVLSVSSCEAPKEPAVSGTFYPADPKTLADNIDAYLKNVQDIPVDGKLIALISPHAGYVFSGQIAAYSYSRLKDRKIKTVIIIGPSHYAHFYGASVYTDGAWKTPLGTVRIDSRIAKTLVNPGNQVIADKSHFQNEHSIEVQLPFLQRILKNFNIVPILVAGPSDKAFSHLRDALTDILKNRDDAILIASSDLSHYFDAQTAMKMDMTLIESLESLSAESTWNSLAKKECEMCGAYPVLITMGVARNLGANKGVVYKYANSGDVTGELGRVVGYVSFGFYRASLTSAEKLTILNLARDTVVNYTLQKELLGVELTPLLKASGATFVTIKKNGKLRGCIGNIMPDMPLHMSITRNAVSAASQDPRFPPLKKEELPEITVEVSVISPMSLVSNPTEIKIGRDGLLITFGNKSGVFLPQVATEQGWDRDTFIKEVCSKAGMTNDECKSGKLNKFTAEVISD